MNIDHRMATSRLAQTHELDFTRVPLVSGMCRSPWHVALAAKLDYWSVSTGAICAMFHKWPTPQAMAQCDPAHLARVLRVYEPRARRLKWLSHKWDSVYLDILELPGIVDWIKDIIIAECFNELCEGTAPIPSQVPDTHDPGEGHDCAFHRRNV